MKNYKLYNKAIESGCTPVWYDGIVGLSWHCGCNDNIHGCDSQCSVITQESLVNVEKLRR